MPVGAIAGSAVIGAGSNIIAGNKAANAQEKSANQADATQRYFYDTTRSDQAPFREAGYGALDKLQQLYGLGGNNVDWEKYVTSQPDLMKDWQTYASGSGKYRDIADYGKQHFAQFGGGEGRDLTPYQTSGPSAESLLEKTPGYQFRMDEGQKAIERSAASRGLLKSGASLKALTRFAQGTASDEFNNYSNRLAALAGIGQTGVQATSNAGSQAANGISNAQMAAGNARASSYANIGSSINNGAQNLASLYLYQQQGGFKPVGATA